MIAAELLGLLERCDPEAQVRIMMQESWPFECCIAGIAVREEFTERRTDHARRRVRRRRGPDPWDYGDGLAAGAIFIVRPGMSATD